MSRQNPNPVAHLDQRAVKTLADHLSHLEHPGRGGEPAKIMRLVQLDGTGPGTMKIKKDLAEAIIHHLYVSGFELKRRRGRG